MPSPVDAAMKDRVVLVTGSSRGVGARVATLLAGLGARLVINYRQRAPLANKVAEAIARLGAQALTVRADLTQPQDVQHLFDGIERRFGRLDVLVLNASGGLENDKPADYAMRLNVKAQLDTVDAALRLMAAGSRIVFVTSHHAHFHGQRATVGEYEAVAASKRAGETALRARLPEFAARGISLVVVSGDVIERTVTAGLLERARPELFARRRARLGPLLSVEAFASAVAHAAHDPNAASGDTLYVGSTEPDIEDAELAPTLARQGQDTSVN
jgi:NAD(P)-dependent dehydrogenase (short-subunit alcohol dehydrogenase family)